MKSFLCWTIGIALLFIGITAFTMHEVTIGLVFTAAAVGAVWAAPTGTSTKTSATASRR